MNSSRASFESVLSMPVPARRVASSSISSFLRSLIRWLRDEYEVRRAAKDLEWMDDRLLKDIRISRQDIRHVVRHGRIP